MTQVEIRRVQDAKEFALGKPGNFYFPNATSMLVRIEPDWAVGNRIHYKLIQIPPKKPGQDHLWLAKGKNWRGTRPMSLQQLVPYLVRAALDYPSCIKKLFRSCSTHYKLPPLEPVKILSKGSFGTVYEGKLGNIKCAIKVEDRQQAKEKAMLKSEFRSYELLERVNHDIVAFRSSSSNPSLTKHHHHQQRKYAHQGFGAGLPSVYKYIETHDCNIMIMSLHGYSLREMVKARGPLSVVTVLIVGYQILGHLEFMHSRFLVHRDIKPANIVIGKYDDEQDRLSNFCVYLLDLGLAKPIPSKQARERWLEKRRQYKSQNEHQVSGTINYMGLASMQGSPISPRDDLQSLAYTLVWLRCGQLPWSSVPDDSTLMAKMNPRERQIFVHRQILQMKQKTTHQELAKTFPRAMCEFFRYILQLPESLHDIKYSHLRNCLMQSLRELKTALDYSLCSWFDPDYLGLDASEQEEEDQDQDQDQEEEDQEKEQVVVKREQIQQGRGDARKGKELEKPAAAAAIASATPRAKRHKRN